MRPVRRLTVCLALLLPWVAACADFPDLDARISPGARSAAYPHLVPMNEVADRRRLARTTGTEGEVLAARAAALRARARLLRGVPVDDGTRLRLAPTLNRLGG